MTIQALKQAMEFIDSVKVHPTQIATRDALHTTLRTAIEQAEKQEPVCEVLNERGEVDYISYVPPVGTPLYTAPRQWVGLTEDEVDDIWNRYCDEMGEASINDAEDIARAIEAKLKEKNV